MTWWRRLACALGCHWRLQEEAPLPPELLARLQAALDACRNYVLDEGNRSTPRGLCGWCKKDLP